MIKVEATNFTMNHSREKINFGYFLYKTLRVKKQKYKYIKFIIQYKMQYKLCTENFKAKNYNDHNERLL